MFTGIIEETGTVTRIKKQNHSASLEINAHTILDDVQVGDSISVNGICLTVTSFHGTAFTADVMHETLNRSTLSQLTTGTSVNLERAMAASGRFGGHIVSGHIDGTGKIIRIAKDSNAVWYTITADRTLLRYIVEKGSIAVDGISLTVASVESDCFSVSAIPHTIQETTLKDRRQNDVVNLETDMIGKYVERFLLFDASISRSSNITKDFLQRCGY